MNFLIRSIHHKMFFFPNSFRHETEDQSPHKFSFVCTIHHYRPSNMLLSPGSNCQMMCDGLVHRSGSHLACGNLTGPFLKLYPWGHSWLKHCFSRRTLGQHDGCSWFYFYEWWRNAPFFCWFTCSAMGHQAMIDQVITLHVWSIIYCGLCKLFWTSPLVTEQTTWLHFNQIVSPVIFTKLQSG